MPAQSPARHASLDSGEATGSEDQSPSRIGAHWDAWRFSARISL